MKFLVIGLGSMGKRRVRCLKALGHSVIAGFDPRVDRRKESENQYGIEMFSDYESALSIFKPDALLICVPPDHHHTYMKSAVENKLPFFVEASVVDTDLLEIAANANKNKVVAVPSATLSFHPAIKKIAELVKSGRLGTISNVLLHSGQYLPDWHTYEKVSEYYVSNPETGGAREIVPFELTWFTQVFGLPKRVGGNFRKTIHIEGAEKIDDTYNALLDYESFLAVLTVDVVSRFGTRRLTINGDQAQLVWHWEKNAIQIFNPDGKGNGEWETIGYENAPAAAGYNANISEGMYIDEVKNFVQAAQNGTLSANTLEKDLQVLKVLYAIEKSDRTSQFINIQK
jgi:predicted dehydrogenase